MANLVAIGPELLALSKGEGGRLDDNGKAEVTRQICETVGLNPATIPIQWINLSGKLVPYFTKGATDQIRQAHGISVEILERRVENDLSVVRCRATTKDGRQDESIGAVSVKGLTGEALANAYMKSETKSKRRVTLSIMGLGLLDESEIGEPRATHEQLAEIRKLIIDLGGGKELMEWIKEKYGKSDQLTQESADMLIGHLKQRMDGCSDDKGSDGEPKTGGV